MITLKRLALIALFLSILQNHLLAAALERENPLVLKSFDEFLEENKETIEPDHRRKGMDDYDLLLESIDEALKNIKVLSTEVYRRQKANNQSEKYDIDEIDTYDGELVSSFSNKKLEDEIRQSNPLKEDDRQELATLLALLRYQLQENNEKINENYIANRFKYWSGGSLLLGAYVFFQGSALAESMFSAASSLIGSQIIMRVLAWGQEEIFNTSVQITLNEFIDHCSLRSINNCQNYLEDLEFDGVLSSEMEFLKDIFMKSYEFEKTKRHALAVIAIMKNK